MIQRILDRLHDRLNGSETARAYDERGRCIAVLRLPKGYSSALGELVALMEDNCPEDTEIVIEPD